MNQQNNVIIENLNKIFLNYIDNKNNNIPDNNNIINNNDNK